MGSSSYDHELGINGTEKEFVQGIINYLEGLNTKIVCTSNIDDEFDETDLTHVPVFTFKIDNNLTFTLTRYYNNAVAPLSADAHDYVFNYGSVSVKLQFFDSWHPHPRNQVNYRSIHVTHVVNDDFILLAFRSGYEHNESASIVYTTSNSKYYTNARDFTNIYSKANVFDITNRTFVESVTSNTAAVVSRFSYIAEPGKIDYIKSAVCLNNGNKEFEFTSVFDCTTVTIGDTVSLKDGSYMAVGPHQLVKMS